MFGLLASLKHRSEAALRSAILLAAAGGLAVLSLGFGAAAFVAFLNERMPLWAALLCGAGVLATIAAGAAALASRKPAAATPAAAPAAAALLGAAASSSSLKDLVLRLAEHEARHNPAAAAAIAAAVGLLVGALEGEATGPASSSEDDVNV